MSQSEFYHNFDIQEEKHVSSTQNLCTIEATESKNLYPRIDSNNQQKIYMAITNEGFYGI
jgi:hypothetical protein